MVRPARPEDALAVARVHVRAWQDGYAGLEIEYRVDLTGP